MVIGKDEETCDLPGLPISAIHRTALHTGTGVPVVSVEHRKMSSPPVAGEENLLALPQDKYMGENILIHEFAHLIHMVGIAGVEPDFNDRLEALWKSAGEKDYGPVLMH